MTSTAAQLAESITGVQYNYEQIFINESSKWAEYTELPFSPTESVAFSSGVPHWGPRAQPIMINHIW